MACMCTFIAGNNHIFPGLQLTIWCSKLYWNKEGEPPPHNSDTCFSTQTNHHSFFGFRCMAQFIFLGSILFGQPKGLFPYFGIRYHSYSLYPNTWKIDWIHVQLTVLSVHLINTKPLPKEKALFFSYLLSWRFVFWYHRYRMRGVGTPRRWLAFPFPPSGDCCPEQQQ